jgi:hypothetical protein
MPLKNSQGRLYKKSVCLNLFPSHYLRSRLFFCLVFCYWFFFQHFHFLQIIKQFFLQLATRCHKNGRLVRRENLLGIQKTKLNLRKDVQALVQNQL